MSTNISIEFLHEFIRALSGFKGMYEKKFNFSKLMGIKDMNVSEGEQILKLILQFQDLFNIFFRNHIIEKKTINGTTYLVTKEKNNHSHPSNNTELNGMKEDISLNQKQTESISDLIYRFKFIERGKGFNLDNGNDNDLLNEAKKIKEKYPFLFIENGNNLTYPAELLIRYGDLLLKFDKGNKKLKNINITYNFQID